MTGVVPLLFGDTLEITFVRQFRRCRFEGYLFSCRTRLHFSSSSFRCMFHSLCLLLGLMSAMLLFAASFQFASAVIR